MADLDSFFAKKGKKKRTKGIKRQTDGGDGSEDKVAQLTVNSTQEEETEWKEIQDTVKISADDLKVQTLSLDEPAYDDGIVDVKVSSSSKAHDMLSIGKDQDGTKANLSSPWQSLPKEEEFSSPTTTVTNISSKGGGSAYVPPSRRNKSTKHANSEPPDITSESAFPSLIVLKEEKEKRKNKPSSDDDDDDIQRPMFTELHLQNMFSGLRNE